MNFNFHMPAHVVTGPECIRENAQLLKELGSRCLIVTGKNSAVRSGALADVTAALESQGILWELFDQVKQNPLLEDSYRAGGQARAAGADFIVGIGGGSPLDAAKTAAVYGANDIPMMDIYNGWTNRVLPLVAVGTTAGTGSEVGPFSVMTTPDGRKNTVTSMQLCPTITFADPKYTYSLPWAFTVSTGLDALTHAMEAYFSVLATDMMDMYCVQAVKMLWKALSRLETADREAELPHDLRDELFYASIVAGVALGHCSTCYCHRLGYFLTEERGVAHGTACALFLPGFLRRADRLMPERSAQLYRGADCTVEELCGLVERLTFMEEEITLTKEQVEEIANRSRGTRNLTNTAPAGLSHEEAIEILTGLFVK